MHRSILGALIGLVGVFIIGAVIVIANGRPVAKMAQNSDNNAVETNEAVGTTITTDDEEEGENEDREDNETDDAADATTPSTAPTTPAETTTTPAGTYTMADVQLHATASDCWSAVNGNVYDLTTWVSRHPGGSGAIIGMCGADGSAKFNRKHSGFAAALDTLILLKIGALAS